MLVMVSLNVFNWVFLGFFLVFCLFFFCFFVCIFVSLVCNDLFSMFKRTNRSRLHRVVR